MGKIWKIRSMLTHMANKIKPPMRSILRVT